MTDLHPLEFKVLEALKETGEMRVEELSKKTGLGPMAAHKAALWLSSKELCSLDEAVETYLLPTRRGEETRREGLPEKNVLRTILDAKASPMQELYGRFGSEQLNAALGRLRSTDRIIMKKNESGQVMLFPTQEGVKWLNVKSEIEQALDALCNHPNHIFVTKSGAVYSLDQARSGAYMPAFTEEVIQILLERGFAEVRVRKTLRVKLTKAGHDFPITRTRALTSDSWTSKEKVNQLIPAMLESGTWKNADFREYDINAPSETINPGRPHPLRLMIEKVRRAFLNMGFTESAGPWVESSFWCFDSIFVPQDHPARDMADTFYMKTPDKIPLPENGFVAGVKKAHEHGVAGSAGWRYKWSPEAAESAVLRTHTTSVSARALHSGIKPPAKIFCVGKAFRNETLDYKHLSELHQVEGMVFDRNVTFSNLLGYLKEFLSLLGFERVRFRPAYFPYTELSVEPEVFVEEKGEWMELGGAGIFRPEVVVPLAGVDCPVLAWGLGLDRLAMMMLDLKDIRDLYRNDLAWLRSTPLIGGWKK